MARILLVEDTERLAASIALGLREEGFVVEAVADGVTALERLRGPDVDALILDLGLPDIDGNEVIERARGAQRALPILVLTARDAISSRVAALERGADDYLVKPFAFEELLARIPALLRRAAGPRWAPLSCGDLRLELGENCARIGAKTVELSPRERPLLELLLRRQGETIGRAEILSEVFGYDFDPGTNLVDVHIAHLRRKIEGAPLRSRPCAESAIAFAATGASTVAERRTLRRRLAVGVMLSTVLTLLAFGVVAYALVLAESAEPGGRGHEDAREQVLWAMLVAAPCASRCRLVPRGGSVVAR